MSISTLELIIGSPPKEALTAATGWASQHQAELMAKWQELNP